MNKGGFLEFLFIGPLFSVFKSLNTIREGQMATQEQINALAENIGRANNQLQKGLGEVRAEIARLTEQVGEEIDLSALTEKVEALTGAAQELDNVVPDQVSPNPEPDPSEVSTESPGEPDPVETDGPEEDSENV